MTASFLGQAAGVEHAQEIIRQAAQVRRLCPTQAGWRSRPQTPAVVVVWSAAVNAQACFRCLHPWLKGRAHVVV